MLLLKQLQWCELHLLVEVPVNRIQVEIRKKIPFNYVQYLNGNVTACSKDGLINSIW